MPLILCKICGSEKFVKPHKLREGRGIFCSVRCYNFHKRTPEHKAKIANWFGAGACANKGIKRSEELLIRLSEAQKKSWSEGRNRGFTGKQHSEVERKRRATVLLGKPALHLRGENSPLWRGGVTPENHRIRSSVEYKNWRRNVFKRDNWTCVMCGKRGGELNADHIKPFATYPNLRFDISNGRTLCVPCHKTTPSYMNRWAIDSF